MRVGAVQLRAGTDPVAVRDRARRLVTRAAQAGAELVVLPELFAALGPTATMVATAEPLDGPTTAWAGEVAAEHGCWLVAGSIVERADDGRLHNTTTVFDPSGRLVAHYRKIHLFDVSVAGAESRESATFAPGDTAVTVTLGSDPDDPVLGLTICYDLRFPELFTAETVAGARLIALPAAFTAATGRAHWEVLVRARAIENQVVVVAAAQWGTSPDGIARHGHSMIVDGWGNVLAEAPGVGDTAIVADVDLPGLDALRARLPSISARRPEAWSTPDPTLRP